MNDHDETDSTGMTDEEKRRDQLTSAPNAVESDADPRIDVTHRDGVTRIDIRDDADVRPGNPTKDPGE
ncbi:hypothetical protein Q9R08_15355 [Microbacterium sp. QXD-8]|uniref:Multidrug transporter n=1 Tax=Microbacterium psychrotolerans TaxID=3068321 RepID=A0ABU0Z456_9MICO|nr:hypothetical protein [Microbacterium sp. QXD-8]MDQ7879367.1 hypothetical protein [Microbacterium sp. QXD-8]